MMDYRKRSYQCPARRQKEEYQVEMAYELGAEYQKELMEHQQQLKDNARRRRKAEEDGCSKDCGCQKPDHPQSRQHRSGNQ